MSPRAYYNEIDPFAAQWLRNLIDAGEIMAGDVDERSIVDVQPSDLKGYTRCHFFAGIGVWDLALAMAGWPLDRPVWTGSCPCQPFSSAGLGKGEDDERHLFPAWLRIIREREPSVVLGEQTASRLGRSWLASVFDSLEDLGYAVAGADLCAAGVGAPHIRQRLFWVGNSEGERLDGDRHAGAREAQARAGSRRDEPENASDDGRLGNARRVVDERRRGSREARGATEATQGEARQRERCGHASGGAGANGGLADNDGHGQRREPSTRVRRGQPGHDADRRRGVGYWADVEFVLCREADGRLVRRPVEAGTFPLAHGAPGRVGQLRAYGNAIVPQVAAAFIGAFMEAAA